METYSEPLSLAADLASDKLGAVLTRRPDRTAIRLTGSERVAFLHNMTTGDVKRLHAGEGLSAAMVNQRGGILDWLDVYAGVTAHWVVTGPGRGADDLAWLDRYLITEDVQLESLADTHTLLYLTGPQALPLLGTWLPGADELNSFSQRDLSVGGFHLQVFGTHGLRGPGFHLLVANGELDAVCLAIAPPGGQVALANDEALEVLRVEAGLPLVGRELQDNRNPWEGRLDLSVSLDKGCYLGQEIVARLNTYDKVQRYLVGLRWRTDGLPPVGSVLYDGEREVGHLTSAVRTPQGFSGLAFVKAAQAQPGRALTLRDGERETTVEVEDRPFWHGKTRPVSFSS